MTRTRTMVLAALASVVVALGACGGGGGDDGAAAEGGTITFWIQSADPFVAAHREVIRAFERENPGVRVDLQTYPFAEFQTRLTASLPAGRGPDVLEGYTPWMVGPMRTGQLDPVPASFGSNEQIEQRYYPSTLGQLRFDDRFYGVPANLAAGATRVLLVNDDVVRRAGVELPGDSAHFEDWVGAWRRLTQRRSGTIRVAGLGQSCGQPADQFISYLLAYGGSLLSPDGRRAAFNGEQGRRALGVLRSLVVEDEVDSPRITDANCIPQGVAATGYRGTWVTPEYARDFPDFEGTYHRMPLPPGATRELWQGGSGWATFVPARGDQRELAWRFVRFLDAHRRTWIDRTGEIPASRELAAEVAKARPELYAAYFPILEQSRNAYVAGDYFVIYQALSDMYTATVTQGVAVDQALARAQRTVDDHLGQWWSQYGAGS